jgi:hypothetical protein
MDEELQQAWQDLQQGLSLSQDLSVLSIVIYLVIAGLLGQYVRFLYGRYGAYASDADPITRVFPMLSIITTGVIAVVKSSLALSLGLVGALSIVRFRAAIKEPEELVYLFLCIAVGLSLGASQPLVAIAVVVVATVFVLGMHVLGHRVSQQRLMLTVSGDANQYFNDVEPGVLSAVERVVGNGCKIHRINIEDGRGEARILLPRARAQDIGKVMVELRCLLPDCEFSYVDMHSTW